MYKLRCKILIMVLIFVISITNVRGTSPEDIKILLIVDHDYGANYHYIKDIFLSYGWNVTTTGLFPAITPCEYQSKMLYVDILIQNITNITEFHCISIMPGESHENLVNNETTQNLIQIAVSEGLTVTAWCKGVCVLAEAGVIDGKNVTGHSSIRSVCETAGATFFDLSPPIRDGNIITSVRSRYYRTETCELIRDTIYESLGIPTPMKTTTTKTTITTTSLERSTNLSTLLIVLGLFLTPLIKARGIKK